MSIEIKSDLAGSTLYCDLCDFVNFSSYSEFYSHHLTHVRQPHVRLVKINSNLSAKLQNKSYKLNTGVARRSHNTEHVPPLKISVVNQQGLKQFQVIKERNNSADNCPVFNVKSGTSDCDKKNIFDDNTDSSEVEGNNLLERFGANISVSRRGKSSSQLLAKTGPDNTGNGVGNVKKKTETINVNVDFENEDFLDKLSGIGGISISSKPKLSTNNNSDHGLVSDVSVSSKVQTINIKQLKKLKDNKRDKKALEKNKLLEKLNESGTITVATKSKTGSLPEVDKYENNDYVSEGKFKESRKSLIEKFSQKNNKLFRSKSEDCNDKSYSKKNGDVQVQSGEDEVDNKLNENDLEIGERKRFPRVKKSSYSKKAAKVGKHFSFDETFLDENSEKIESRNTDNVHKETGIDILERLTENLNNTVGGKKSAIVEKLESTNPKTMEKPLISACVLGDQQRLELSSSVNQSECNNAEKDRCISETNLQEEEESSCPLLLTPPSSSGQDGENSSYSNNSLSHQNDQSFSEVSERNNEINDNTISFTALNREDQSQEQTESQNSFWSDLRNGSNCAEQTQRDSLMTPENSVSNGGETLNSNFLHNFLGDHSGSNNIPNENSEYMSLDRLAQTQHPSSSYDLTNGDSNSPMEHLSQQVQRISNPSSQINVISQHHMQTSQPPPPQLHTAVPLSPQHLSPQQSNSFDALSHIQPPMPPPLYQGFNMFSQNFSSQAPQHIPRPPLLQQRPQIQSRNFQNLGAHSRQRARGPKRNVVTLPPSHEIPPPKQPRRLDPLQARPQFQNSTTAKLPSGITVTPPKNASEANKVANVLASRGITVTPAVNRQANQALRSQSRNTGQSPVLNIGSGISITSSNQNRTSGGFAVPSPRRNPPIVNHNIERPERCTTVDLTQDDEPQMSHNKMTSGKFSCKQCGKIFTSAFTLESHKASHRATTTLPYKCDKCTAQYTTSGHLQQHKLNFHKTKQSAPDLAIPIVDLNHPGAREQLLKCGIYNFIPLSQLQSNNNGYFGVPIIQLESAKEKAVSNLSSLGAGNIFVLGKMKALVPQPNQ